MFSGEVLRIVITVLISLLVLTKGLEGAFTISLKGGGDNHEGYIVTLIDGQYEGRICDDTWDDTDASVACRQLGLGNSGRAYVGSENLKFDGWQGTIEFYEFECTGDEEKLSDCDFKYVLVEAQDCPGEFVAGLRCYKDYDVRLSGSSPNPDTAGRLEIYMNGNWATVCDEGWDDEDAVVACRQFTGIPEQEKAVAIGGALYGKGTGEVGFANFKCNGSESTLRECAYTPMPDSAQCGHQRDAGVDCNGGSCSSQPCKNNGRCQETTSDGNIVCTCQDGYEGTLCEVQSQPQTSIKESSNDLVIISVITVAVCLATFFLFLIISYIVMKLVIRDVENNVVVVIPTAPSIEDLEMSDQVDDDNFEARSWGDGCDGCGDGGCDGCGDGGFDGCGDGGFDGGFDGGDGGGGGDG